MNKQYILRVTLFVSVLVMNPAVAQVNLRTAQVTQQKEAQCDLQMEVAAALEAKGLERDVAEQIVKEHLKGAEIAQMVEAIATHTSLSKASIVAYLGEKALFRKSVDLTSYDALLSMVGSITNHTPDVSTRAKLKQLSKYYSRQTV